MYPNNLYYKLKRKVNFISVEIENTDVSIQCYVYAVWSSDLDHDKVLR